MKLLLAIQIAVACRVGMLCCIPLTVMSGAAFAQTTGSVNPSPAAAEPSVKVDVPPGGCMPIGLTASGEFVFPILCRELIERERGKFVEQKPAVVEEKAAVKQSEAVATESSQPANKPVEIDSSKRVEDKPREPAKSPDGCTHYRTYDQVSGTYTGYDGRRRSCR